MSLLIDNPVLLLFIVIGVGGALGSVRVKGVALGPAAALFVGLAFSAYDERLANTPLVVSQIGLALFIYTIGLASGPSFLAELRRGGARVLLGAAVLLALIAAGIVGLASLFDLDAGARAGLFAGVAHQHPGAVGCHRGARPTGSPTAASPTRWSVTRWPTRSVVMMLLAARWSLRRPASAHVGRWPGGAQGGALGTSATVLVRRDDLPVLGELRHWNDTRLAFSRFEHDGRVELATTDVQLVPGDLCMVIGAPADVERVHRVGR